MGGAGRRGARDAGGPLRAGRRRGRHQQPHLQAGARGPAVPRARGLRPGRRIGARTRRVAAHRPSPGPAAAVPLPHLSRVAPPALDGPHRDDAVRPAGAVSQRRIASHAVGGGRQTSRTRPGVGGPRRGGAVLRRADGRRAAVPGRRALGARGRGANRDVRARRRPRRPARAGRGCPGGLARHRGSRRGQRRGAVAGPRLRDGRRLVAPDPPDARRAPRPPAAAARARARALGRPRWADVLRHAVAGVHARGNDRPGLRRRSGRGGLHRRGTTLPARRNPAGAAGREDRRCRRRGGLCGRETAGVRGRQERVGGDA